MNLIVSFAIKCQRIGFISNKMTKKIVHTIACSQLEKSCFVLLFVFILFCFFSFVKYDGYCCLFVCLYFLFVFVVLLHSVLFIFFSGVFRWTSPSNFIQRTPIHKWIHGYPRCDSENNCVILDGGSNTTYTELKEIACGQAKAFICEDYSIECD